MLLVSGCSSRNMTQQMAWQGVAKQLLAQGGAQNLLSNFGIPTNTKYTKSTSTPTSTPVQTAEQKTAEERENQEAAARFLNDLYSENGSWARTTAQVEEVGEQKFGIKKSTPQQKEAFSKCHNWCYAKYGNTNYNVKVLYQCRNECQALLH
jgi:hypothetical protein